MAQEISSPATLTVQPFTPINACSGSVDTSEAIPTISQPGNAANNGKKRQRRLSTQVSPNQDPACPRRPKKSKPGHHQPENEASPATAKNTEAQGLDAHGLGPLGGSENPFSPATYQAVQSPVITGLGSVYQAAFELEEKRSIPAGLSDLGCSSMLASTDTDTKNGIFAGEYGLPSISVGTVEPTPGEGMSIGKTFASDLDGLPAQPVTGSVYQVPCASDILPGVQYAEATDVKTNAVTAPLPSLEQYLLDHHPNDDEFEHHCAGTSPPHLDEYEIDVPDFEDTLLAATKDEPSLQDRDQDDQEISLLMSEFTNSQGEVSGDTSEFSTAPHELSFSFGTDVSKSFNEKDVNNVLSDTSFVESSSPYLRSRSDLQEDFDHLDVPAKPASSDQTFTSEDIFNDDDIEAVFAECQSPPSAQVPRPPSPSPVTSSFNQTTLSILKTEPLAPKPKQEASSSKNEQHKISFDHTDTPIPFIRTPFPAPIRDRSPVIGLGSQTLLKTCFRVGEALNAASLALRTKQDIVIELYARVVYSERPPKSVKQQFQFSDIFSPDRPPFLKGTYGLWKGVELWDLDSKIFLGEKGRGKMARVVERMGREEKSRGLEMTVLSIWETRWEDVEVVKGIVCR
ncbi:MAG: hypothetical protein Q9216_006361 [Gyalolechia sp. 2 TL-2023]